MIYLLHIESRNKYTEGLGENPSLERKTDYGKMWLVWK